MNLVIAHMSSFRDTPYADILVESIKKYMPDTNLIQIADRDAPEIIGASKVIRGDYEYSKVEFPKMFFGIVADMGLPEVVYCDTDMIFKADIRPLLDDNSYKVAVCNRHKGDGSGKLYRSLHPYNAGLIISKTPEFWKRCQSVISNFEKSRADLAQYVLGLVVDSGAFKVKFLDGGVYNRCPATISDFDDSVKVWHFKGPRKTWIREWMVNADGKRII